MSQNLVGEEFAIFCQLRVKPWGKYVADVLRLNDVSLKMYEAWSTGLPIGKLPLAGSSPSPPTPRGHQNKQSSIEAFELYSKPPDNPMLFQEFGGGSNQV